MKTVDGYTVTNVLQDGPLAGEHSSKLIIMRKNTGGYDWWDCHTKSEAQYFVRMSRNMTRAGLIEELGGDASE